MTFSFRDAERRLWLEGAAAYRDLMHPDAIMIFAMAPPILVGAEIVKSLEGAPRWDAITLRNVREADAEGTHVFAYTGRAERKGADAYVAACLSVWVDTSDGWRILSHQHTPLDA